MTVGTEFITDWKHNNKLVKLSKIEAIHLGKASKGLRKVTSPHDVCFSIIKKKKFGRETLDFETKRLSHRTYVIFNIIENMQPFGLSAEKVEVIKSMVLSNENQDEILEISLDPQNIAALSANVVKEPQIKMDTTEWTVSWHKDGHRNENLMVIDWETIMYGNADTDILNLVEIQEIQLWNGTDGFQDDGGPSNVSFSIVPYSEETGWKTLGFEMRSAEDRTEIIVDILDKLQYLGVYPIAEDGMSRQVVLDGMKSDKTMQIRLMHYADESDDSGDVEKGLRFSELTRAVDDPSAQGRTQSQVPPESDSEFVAELAAKIFAESTAKSQEKRSLSHDDGENPDSKRKNDENSENKDLVSVHQDHLKDGNEMIQYENIDKIRLYDKNEIPILGIRTSAGERYRIKWENKKLRDKIAMKLITKMDTFGKTPIDDDVDSLKEQIRNLQSGDILRIKLETRTRADSIAESPVVSAEKSDSVESLAKIDRINDQNEAVTWSRQSSTRIMNDSDEVATVVHRPQFIGENVPKELEQEKCDESEDSGDIEKGSTFPESTKNAENPSAREASESPPFERFSKMLPNIPRRSGRLSIIMGQRLQLSGDEIRVVDQTGSTTATKFKDIANIRLNQESSLYCVSITTTTGKMHRFASTRKKTQQRVPFELVRKMKKIGKMPINQDMDTLQHRIANLGKDDVFDITYHQIPPKLESVVESVTETEPIPESSLSIQKTIQLLRAKGDEAEDSGDIEKGFTFSESTENMEIPSAHGAHEGSEPPQNGDGTESMEQPAVSEEKYHKMEHQCEKKEKELPMRRKWIVTRKTIKSLSAEVDSQIKRLNFDLNDVRKVLQLGRTQIEGQRGVLDQQSQAHEQVADQKVMMEKENQRLQKELRTEQEKKIALQNQMDVHRAEAELQIQRLKHELSDSRRELTAHRMELDHVKRTLNEVKVRMNVMQENVTSCLRDIVVDSIQTTNVKPTRQCVAS